MIRHGDCLEILPTLPAESIDAIVTDPPYGLSFMGQNWDHGIPGVAFWSEALRVAKPGTHLLAFGGTRTFHRLTVAIEDAGWEIRDCIMWVYGSGFPKSHDVSKAIDREAGAEREVVGAKHVTNCAAAHKDGYNRIGGKNGYDSGKAIPGLIDITAPATLAAQQWQGWGTALKPAWEPIIVARKPLAGTVAENVLAHGAGALNIDGCRVGDFQNTTPSGVDRRNAKLAELGYRPGEYQMGDKVPDTPPGRWPANLIHDGSDEVLAGFPDSNGSGPARTLMRGQRDDGWGMADRTGELRDAGTGSAARFFYCAKASKSDRGNDNTHPTVKPTDLMRYLCRLVTPPGGVVLDPFMGSGSSPLVQAAHKPKRHLRRLQPTGPFLPANHHSG